MERTEYGLYVPATHARHDVRAGSAIVGERREGMVLTDYEGGGASNVQTFEEKMHHAAGRRAQNYPTVARRGWDEADVVQVGSIRYDDKLRRWVIAEITDPDALEAWAPGPHVVGGSDALVLAASGRRWSELSPAEQVRIQAGRGTPRQTADAIIAALARRSI